MRRKRYAFKDPVPREVEIFRREEFAHLAVEERQENPPRILNGDLSGLDQFAAA